MMPKQSRQEREETRRQEAKAERQEQIKAIGNVAANVVKKEVYEKAKAISEQFDNHWEGTENKKWLLAFLLRRTAAFIEMSYLSESAGKSAKDAVWNVTGALLGGAEGAGSMSQMGVQNADLRYRTTKMAADNIYRLAEEIVNIKPDFDSELMKTVKDAILVIRKKGVGANLVNVQELIFATDKLVTSIYSFDVESLVALEKVEKKRKDAFRKAWADRFGSQVEQTQGYRNIVRAYDERFHPNNPKS